MVARPDKWIENEVMGTPVVHITSRKDQSNFNMYLAYGDEGCARHNMRTFLLLSMYLFFFHKCSGLPRTSCNQIFFAFLNRDKNGPPKKNRTDFSPYDSRGQLSKGNEKTAV